MRSDACHETLRDGTRVLIRPMRAEDASLERRFVDELSPESRSRRFLGQVNPDDETVRRLADVDPRAGAALIALLETPGADRQIGVGRFYLDGDRATCECAIVVSDEWQRKGLGYLLMQHLIAIARERGVRRMYSIDSADNDDMQRLAAAWGFERAIHPDDPREAIHTLDLGAPGPTLD